jgi:hypothetical protein
MSEAVEHPAPLRYIHSLVCQLVCHLRAAEANICGTTTRQVTRTVNELPTWCRTFLFGRGALQACAFSRSATYPRIRPTESLT